MNPVELKKVAIVLIVCLLSACSTHPKRVDCESHLQPINPAAPVPTTPEPTR